MKSSTGEHRGKEAPKRNEMLYLDPFIIPLFTYLYCPYFTVRHYRTLLSETQEVPNSTGDICRM